MGFSLIQCGYSTLRSPYTYTSIIVVNIVCVMRAHDHSLSNALQQAGTPEVILKREQ